MKRLILCIGVLVLVLQIGAGAATETADDLSYTMLEKLLMQLDDGSGFEGTLTITADAVEGRESEAFSTIMPLVIDVSYITPKGSDTASPESRLMLDLNASEYQQGSAEFSLQDGAVYMQSSLLADGWYLLNSDILQPLLEGIGVQSAFPAELSLSQTANPMPGMISFFTSIAKHLVGVKTNRINTQLQDYLTKIDFWLEGYRENVEMITLDDGVSAMEIDYRLPPSAVKSQLKQLLVDLMNDEELLSSLKAVMSAEQAALYLDAELQPYYFYAVDGLPLEDDMTVRRVMSLKGETIELSVVMPLYDSETGAVTLAFSSKRSGEDMPYENALSLQSTDSTLEVGYRTYETMNGTVVYQGTVLSRSVEEDGTNAPIVWASFDLSILSQKTKDLRGYETQYETVRLSVAPAAIPDGEDAAVYAAFPKTDLAADMKFASLAAQTSPTTAEMTLNISGDDMAQTVTLVLSGSTTARWTPEAFDIAQAVNLAQMPAEDLQTLLSQAVIKGGLLFLPYLNLPQITPENAD